MFEGREIKGGNINCGESGPTGHKTSNAPSENRQSCRIVVSKHSYTHGLRLWWTATAARQPEMPEGGLLAT